MAWLVEWALEGIPKYEVRGHGRTRHEHLTTLGVGESIHFMVVRGDARRNKFDDEGLSG